MRRIKLWTLLNVNSEDKSMVIPRLPLGTSILTVNNKKSPAVFEWNTTGLVYLILLNLIIAFEN